MWKLLLKEYRQGNGVTEAYLDATKMYPHLHSQLIDFSNNLYTPHAPTQLFLASLKEKYPLYLLSNIGHQTLQRLLQRHADYFLIFAAQENSINKLINTDTWKPRPEAYLKALTKINRAHVGHLAIFVDDKLKNVQAAQQAGLNAIRFVSYPQFIEDVAKLLGT